MSYVWVLIARQATSRHGMYDIYFLSSKLDLDLGLNFTERALAMREAYPAPNGNFSYQEDIPVAKNIPVNSTDLSNVMDMLRFTTSSVLLNADEQVNPSDDDTLLVHQPTHRLKYTRDIAAGLAALEGALKGAAATWGTVVQNFKVPFFFFPVFFLFPDGQCRARRISPSSASFSSAFLILPSRPRF